MIGKSRKNSFCTRLGLMLCFAWAVHAQDPTDAPSLDECAKGLDDCDLNAVCTNLGDRGYVCNCKEGFEDIGIPTLLPGRDCLIKATEPPRTEPPVQLTEPHVEPTDPTTTERPETGPDINECASLPCQNGALCIDGIAMYTCQCRQGYSGVNCEEVGFCDLDGVWYNECNDQITISKTSTGMMLGDHVTFQERLIEYGAPTVVVGYASNNYDFPSFGFTVVRDNGQSTTSWTGQCHLCHGQEVLYTTWINTKMVTTCEAIKRANMLDKINGHVTNRASPHNQTCRQ